MTADSSPQVSEVTGLLMAWGKGNRDALERLTPMVDVELRRIAEAYLSRERSGHILQTTALVNEAWMKLIDWRKSSWQSRAHFFGVAASLMRKILVGEARRRRQLKRGGKALQVSLSEAGLVAHGKQPDLIALDDALKSGARTFVAASLVYGAEMKTRIEERARELGIAVTVFASLRPRGTP